MNRADEITADDWAEAARNMAVALREEPAPRYCDSCDELHLPAGGAEVEACGLIQWLCRDCYADYARERYVGDDNEPECDATEEE